MITFEKTEEKTKFWHANLHSFLEVVDSLTSLGYLNETGEEEEIHHIFMQESYWWLQLSNK